MVLVRRAREDDWETVRALRLTALADSPEAFASTLAREEQFPESRWREWPRGGAVFLALVGDGSSGSVAAGMAAGVDGDTADERQVVALWVRPEHRGCGAGRALVSGLAEWAAADGAARLGLWVAHGNAPARRLYAGCGFRDTGERRAMPRDPDVVEERMSLHLDGPTPVHR